MHSEPIFYLRWIFKSQKSKFFFISVFTYFVYFRVFAIPERPLLVKICFFFLAPGHLIGDFHLGWSECTLNQFLTLGGYSNHINLSKRKLFC